MRLNSLTLSGFKSFARTTTFEFPAQICAIVGPNGSGKSNVAEATRWVLGEQSIKTLRGKRGEDLIYSGSTSAARMGKASVTLIFDNRDHSIPLDFETVTLERKIFRDGLNEYYLQGSQVRLKDIVELLARIGLGETKHNIIGQGEVDRLLMSSPRERRELLEEAVGLRLWQLKKREAERKLEETHKNAVQVQALLKEISPHLKFLKSQADKAEKHEVLRRELRDYERAYVSQESLAIAAARAHLAEETKPAMTKLQELERDIKAVRQELSRSESDDKAPERLAVKEKELEALRAERADLERELGRIEGRLEAGGPAHPPGEIRLSLAGIESALTPLIAELEEGALLSEPAELQARLRRVAAKLRRVVAELKPPVGSGMPAGDDTPAAERTRIQGALRTLESGLRRLRAEYDQHFTRFRQTHRDLRQRFDALRDQEEEAAALRAALQRIDFEKEKLALRDADLTRLIEESGLSRSELDAATSPFAAVAPDELRKRIEKLRVRLEEVGSIDEAVLTEYRDTAARHDFLARELGDLTAADKDLRRLIEELEERIERDFQESFAKVKEGFHHYIRIVFGGGKGVLTHTPLRRPSAGEGGAEEETEALEYGIDIDVDLPRKRIKGLAMLSGGERSLVSIALLFAITAVNPPPFLVLDETDSALDEANSQKYAAILQELSEKTQLILITHNRETMQRASILYGMTMGENGISKILSLKLEEAESYGNR